MSEARRSDQADLTRVGPGTVMGEYMRQYWLPCMLSRELEADGTPVRLPLMGEKLIAFRASDGSVGVMDQRCPHRCASLFLGRNEENGLRCVYHGWKFDAQGNCVDMPSVPEGEKLKSRIKAKAYRTAERNGVIWVYMGPDQDAPPPLPQIEANLLPEDQVHLSMVHRDCNWLQSLEGDIDTAHFGFLHGGALDPEQFDPTHPHYAMIADRAPNFEVAERPWGTSYGAYRPSGPNDYYWRVANFLFPFWTQIPGGPFGNYVAARGWIPLDDHRTMFLLIAWKGMPPRAEPKLRSGEPLGDGYGVTDNLLPNSTDWFGRWRLQENEANDWLIDRRAQAEGQNFTGLSNIHLQDQAITESMGPITDHAWEHLTIADRMIGATRRRILREARAYAATKQKPEAVMNPDIFMAARAGFFVAPRVDSWEDAYREQVAKAERPASERSNAELHATAAAK